MMPDPRQEFLTLSTEEGIEPRFSISGAGTVSKAVVRVWVSYPDMPTMDQTFKGDIDSVLGEVRGFIYSGYPEGKAP